MEQSIYTKFMGAMFAFSALAAATDVQAARPFCEDKKSGRAAVVLEDNRRFSASASLSQGGESVYIKMFNTVGREDRAGVPSAFERTLARVEAEKYATTYCETGEYQRGSFGAPTIGK